MTVQITSYPAEVKAGSVFHVKATSTDLDTWQHGSGPGATTKAFGSLMTDLVPAPNPGLGDTTAINTGTVEDIALTGEDSDKGTRNWDVTITAVSDLDGATYLLLHDWWIARDTWVDDRWAENKMHDPDTTAYHYTVKVSPNGPGQGG